MLRVKIELIPWGIEAAAETLDEFVVANDGTGVSGGPDEGGWGNYEIFDGDFPRNVDHPHMHASGFIKHVERTPTHRLFLCEQALGIIQEARKLEGALDGSHNVYDRPTRDFTPEPPKCGIAKDGECLDPIGYCANGDCLADK